MINLARNAFALVFFAIAAGGLLGSCVDLSIPYPDRAALERRPEASLVMLDAVLLYSGGDDHRWTIEGPESSFLSKSFGTTATAEEVHRFYDGELTRRGWAPQRPILYTTDLDAWSWCKGEFDMRVGVPDQRKFVPSSFGGGRFPIVYEVLLTGRDEAMLRRFPCPSAEAPVLREAWVSAAMIAGGLLFIVFAQLTRGRAVATRGPSQRRASGIAQIAPYFLWAPYLVVWLRPGPTLPGPEPVRWLGLVLIVAGIAFALWAVATLGRHYDLVLEIHAGHELVQKGPYRVTRHPVYTGLALHFVGACLATGNVVLIAGTLLVSLPALYVRARAEEQLLRDAFGDEYDRYAREVPMLVPGLRR